MTDADIRAFPPEPMPAGAPLRHSGERRERRERRVWSWVLGAAVLFTLLAAGACAALLLSAFDGLRDSAHVVINGEPWHWPGDWPSDWNGDWNSNWSGDWGGGVLGGVIGFVVATLCIVLTGLLVAFIVVPCVALAVLLAGLGVGVAVAAVLGSVGLVVALVFSPLWLFVLVLWLVFRRRPQRVAA